MKIELYIDGEKKVFTTPFVPMLAKRKYLEVQAKEQEKGKQLTPQESLDFDDEAYSILCNVVFGKQFTLDELYAGADAKYVNEKLVEAVYGIKPKDELEEGNEKGE